MKLNLQIILMALVGASALPSVAFAEEAEGAAAGVATAASDEAAKAEEEDSKDWGISAGFATAIGQGTFVDPANDTEYADIVDPGENSFDRVNMSLGLGASYTFLDAYSVELGIAMVQWLTAGGGYNEPNEFRFQDTSLDFGWAGYQFGDTGLSVSGGLGLVFPTSDLSQTASLIVGTSAAASLSWTLFDGSLSLGYSLGAGKDFHEFTSPVIDEGEVGADNVIWREGGSEVVGQGLYAIDGVNTEWALSNSFSASFGIVEKLRLSISYGISTFWSYDVFDEDEFTPDDANTDRGVAQIVRTGVTLSYPLTPVAEALGLQSFGLSLGTRTSMQPKTDDNQSFRFPFWNLDGAARNYSQIRFGISAAY